MREELSPSARLWYHFTVVGSRDTPRDRDTHETDKRSINEPQEPNRLTDASAQFKLYMFTCSTHVAARRYLGLARVSNGCHRKFRGRNFDLCVTNFDKISFFPLRSRNGKLNVDFTPLRNLFRERRSTERYPYWGNFRYNKREFSIQDIIIMYRKFPQYLYIAPHPARTFAAGAAHRGRPESARHTL